MAGSCAMAGLCMMVPATDEVLAVAEQGWSLVSVSQHLGKLGGSENNSTKQNEFVHQKAYSRLRNRTKADLPEVMILLSQAPVSVQ